MTAPRVPGWLLLIAAMTAVGPVSIDMYLPGFTAIERELAQQGVERTMAAYMIGIAVGQLIYGPLSDHFGRKPPLYVGFALYSLGSLGCMLATSMEALMLMRVLQGVGGCGGMVIGRAIVRDRCEPHEAARVFSTMMMIVALGPVLAPAVGGMFVTALGWRSTFVFQALLGIVLMFAMHRVLVESRAPARTAPLSLMSVGRTYLRLCADRTLVGYCLVGSFGMAGMFSYVTGAPTVLTHLYGLSSQQFGWLIGINGLAFMAASRLNIVALRKHTPQQVLARYVWVPSIFGFALILVTQWWLPPLWLFVALQLSYFVSVGRVSPNVVALALAPHGRDAGTASALMGSLQSLIQMFGALAVAAFNDGSVRRLAMLMGIAAFSALLSYGWARGRRAPS